MKNSKIFSRAQAQADAIADQLNTKIKGKVLSLRQSNGNTNPSDFEVQQMLLLFGHGSTTATGNALNTELQNYDFANYATAARVQAAPAQAQAVQDALV